MGESGQWGQNRSQARQHRIFRAIGKTRGISKSEV